MQRGTTPPANGKHPSDPAPEIGGILGRAIESARRAEEPYLGAGQREEFPAPLRTLFASPVRALAVIFAVYGLAYLIATRDDGPYGTIFAFALLALAIGAVGLALRWIPAAWTGVVVGTDGIIVRRRFIHFSKIADVAHKRHVKRPKLGTFVRLHSGEAIVLELGELDAIATRAILEARAAWLGGEHGSAIDEALMARNQRTGAAWLEGLRRLGARSATAYRARNVDIEHVARLLDDTHARPSARAAAAVVLTTLGDRTAPAKLRIAADSIADPLVRVRLQRVAESQDDEDLAEALEALHELDMDERA